MSVWLIDDRVFLGHRAPHPHPESPERLACLGALLARWDLPRVPPRPATDAEVLAVHETGYLERLRRTDAAGGGYLDPDTFVAADSLAAALHAAGACLDGVDALISGQASAVVALVRPPGHHARPGQGMGFCLLNNVALAAARAVEQGKRVAVLDYDVHHCNGTQEAFWASAEVLVVSMHQSPLYPFSGEADEVGDGPGWGFTRNVPLPCGCGDADYLHALRQLVVPCLATYAPDLLLVSAGYDAHHLDPIGGMELTGLGYRHLLAEAWAAVQHVPLLLALEGGYSPDGLVEGVESSLLEASRGELPPPPPGKPSARVARLVDSVRASWEAPR